MKYLINKLEGTHLSLNDSRLFVTAGGWAPISDSEAESDYVIEALRRDWAEISDTKPAGEAKPAPAPLQFEGEAAPAPTPAPAPEAEPAKAKKAKAE